MMSDEMYCTNTLLMATTDSKTTSCTPQSTANKLLHSDLPLLSGRLTADDMRYSCEEQYLGSGTRPTRNDSEKPCLYQTPLSQEIHAV